MNRNKESMADRLMSLIELNKAKNSIINNIKDLDLFGRINSSECINLMELYKYTCSLYNNKLYSYDLDEKIDLLILINDLIPNFNKNKSILSMITLDEKKLIICKTLLDLGGIEFHLYDNNSNRVNIIQHIMNILNLENNNIEENEVNSEVVNDYMVSDFLNVLYQTVCDEIDITVNIDDKIELTKWKYNLIYLFNILERRIVMTNFQVPNYPNIASYIEIETSGLSLDDYLDNFDSILSSTLESISNRISMQIFKGNTNNLNLLDKIYLKTMVNLLSDKELLDSLCIDSSFISSNANSEVLEKIDEINNIFLNGKENEEKLMMYRRYRTI